MKAEIVESVSYSEMEQAQDATPVVELTMQELCFVAGGIRAIGLITVDK